MGKHPADAILKPYLAGRSWPPEAENRLRDLENRVLARTETPTGTHDLRELLAAVADKENAETKDELARLKRERVLEETEKRKFRDDILKGLIVGVGTVAFIGLGGLAWRLVVLLQH